MDFPKIRQLPVWAGLAFIALAWNSGEALPEYGFRSARLCDNCHANPFETKYQEAWENPKPADRKCNMSCLECHVNPGGGGARTAPGRYYAKSTLPTWGAENRPYHDRRRAELSKLKSWLKQNLGKAEVSSPEPDWYLNPNDRQREDAPDSEKKGFLSLGSPFFTKGGKSQSKYALRQDRYGSVNADPLLSIGGDFRPAVWIAGGYSTFFPMQAEAAATLHPLEHLTLSATLALQGNSRGVSASRDAPENDPVKLQNAFLLIHELPYMAYLQGGFFLPEFGTRTEDHTLPGRRYFEMDPSKPKNFVMGLQAGLAPNYPYASVAAFAIEEDPGEWTGMGGSLNLAYRQVKWGAGTSALWKSRAWAHGGNLLALNANAYHSLWLLFPQTKWSHPVLFQYDYSFGFRDRTAASRKLFHAFAVQADYHVLNGVNLKGNFSWYDDDLEVEGDFLYRVGGGVEWTPVAKIRITPESRITLPLGGSASLDYILVAHFYW